MKRFWAKVDKHGPIPENYPELGPCWLWIACVFLPAKPAAQHGYGAFSVDGKPRGAHRVSWELAFGPIPENLQVLHKCDVRRCVNPAHLFLGTHADNMRDMVKKGRASGPKDPNKFGVPPLKLGTGNGNAKLTDDVVRKIRASDASLRSLARQFGVTHATIARVRRGEGWGHVA